MAGPPTAAALDGAFPDKDRALLLRPGEGLIRRGLRIVPALSGTGLLREVLDAPGHYAAPEWACAAGRALNDTSISAGDYRNVVLALRTREDLRAAVLSSWALCDDGHDGLGGLGVVNAALAVRALLVAELGLQ